VYSNRAKNDTLGIMKAIVEKQVINLIRIKARAIHLTQKKISEELRVSLPTVKRWWMGKGISLTIISDLCALVGMSLSELFSQIEGENAKYTYSLKQENMLVGNPKALAVFDLLISGRDIKQIQRQFGMKDEVLFSLLLVLDRAGLIEVHDKNRVKFKQRGEPQWIIGGPLSKKYRQTMIESFLGDHAKDNMSFYIHDYLPEDVTLLRGKIRELENLMLTFNSRGSMKAAGATSYGSYICLKTFEWDLRELLKKS
jgi:transcriptional regulator with XRE-family HTH domain